jgi:hypothetical protein
MKIVLIHGKDTNPKQKWYPWLANEMNKFGYTFIAPFLPRPEDPIISDWIEAIDLTQPDKDTILIGHSRGGVAILRWLEQKPKTTYVKKVILIATNSGLIKDIVNKEESNYGFYTNSGFDFSKIKSHCNDFVVFHSTDDKWVPFTAGQKNSKGLSAKFIKFEKFGHFGKSVIKIPELINEINI